ncbi:putative membrane protein [Cardiosporidium cionae]|uniref:Membrane protein n=1 Tax=Cardiosporidium cionae TaxID=476202 RepID=A0ABQ7JCV1_9APIC|nr:putative membrane protein [Cardiosporidium cionae]|eukprot:KAF8821842.1 putative membrane protein [Cardiosporidium cionae]
MMASNSQHNSLQLSRQFLLRGALSALLGAILGIIGSLIVNCTLVEISLSVFFSMYFGFLFVTVGMVLIWRLSVNNSEEARSRRVQLLFFAGMIILSGMLCFILKRNWFMGLNPIFKIPIYSLLGVSIAFALTFSIVDMMNYLVGLFHVSLSKSLVESKSQVYLVLCIALTMGGIFGFIFGVMDVEDANTYQIKLALLREEHYCYPIGAILGGVVSNLLAGLGNEYLRQKWEQQSKRWQSEFDDEV